MHRFRDLEVARITPSDMNLRIKSLGAALKVFKKTFHIHMEETHDVVKIEYSTDGQHQVVHLPRHHKRVPGMPSSPHHAMPHTPPHYNTHPQSPHHMSRSAQKSGRTSPPPASSPHSHGHGSIVPRSPYVWHSHVNSHSSRLDSGGVFTPAMLAQERIDSAMTSSVMALTAMTKQLKIMNPIDRLVKLNHKMVSAPTFYDECIIIFFFNSISLTSEYIVLHLHSMWPIDLLVSAMFV